MVKVGITGGIGSGKSTFCNILQSFGAQVLNADDLAKEIMTRDKDVRKEIIKVFGENSYRSDGSLNRRYLAEEAFNKGRVEELNSIVHPRIPVAVSHIMKDAEEEGVQVFVYEAALLLQNLRPDYLDYIILLIADEQKRVERVQQRDDTKENQVMDRIKNQQNFEKLKHLADIVITNNGSLKELKEQAEHIYYDILTVG